MPRYDFVTKRLFVEAPLAASITVTLDRKRANYLLNVLCFKSGDPVLLFNGRDGEWLANIEVTGCKDASLLIEKQTRPQTPESTLTYIFAPLKKARLDYMVQKAVEMGAGRLQPVITEYTQQSKLNLDFIRSKIIEASEQCGIISVPQCFEPVILEPMLAQWPSAMRLIYCDESVETQNPLVLLGRLQPGPVAVLIGPEGGFSAHERELLRSKEFVTAIPLGPRVLRADTAAVAALALVQATIGDWH